MGARFTEEAQLAVVELLRQGFNRSVAAHRAGTTTGTVRALIRAGLDANGEPLPETFAERVQEAEAQPTGKVEAQLLSAAEAGEPWAITLWLKGHARDTYGDKPAVTNVNVDNRTVNIDGTADERRQAIVALSQELDARRALTRGED